MKTILLIFSLLLICSLSAQQDTLLVDTVFFQEDQFQNFFSFDNLNGLRIEESIVEYKKQDNFKQYFFLFMLNLLIVVTLLLSISKYKVKELINTIRNINLLRQLSLKESKKNHTYIYAYYILFFLFFLSLVYVFCRLNNIELNLSKFTFGIIVFFIADSLINNITKYIFQSNEIYNAVYINNVSFMLVSIPLILISIVFIVYLSLALSFYVSFFAALLLFLLYLFKEIRNVFVLQSFKIKIVSFYFFLYLCTFKILPVLILIKYLSRNS